MGFVGVMEEQVVVVIGRAGCGGSSSEVNTTRADQTIINGHLALINTALPLITLRVVRCSRPSQKNNHFLSPKTSRR